MIDAPNQGGGTVRVQCVRCHLFWSFVVELGAGAEVAEEPVQQAARPPISVDEVLELHAILRDLDRPLTELLAQAS